MNAPLPREAGSRVAQVAAAIRARIAERSLAPGARLPSIRKLARMILGELNYTVLTAASPHEAIRLAGEHDGEIQLLMTDVVMPDLNGRELKERIARSRPGIRCLYMSGYAAGAIAPPGILEEGVHFIQKPFSLKELALRVRAVLDLKT